MVFAPIGAWYDSFGPRNLQPEKSRSFFASTGIAGFDFGTDLEDEKIGDRIKHVSWQGLS